jgi:hypothetical protein
MVDERQTDFSIFTGDAAANQAFPAQQLKLSTDGPFVLREIGVAGAGGQLIPSFTVKFQDARGAFLEQDFLSTLQEFPYSGNGPVLTPVVPQIVYPPNGNIVVYLQNTNPSVSLANVRVLFRGVTLYPGGSVLNRSAYPKNFREVPFAYPQTLTQSVSPLLNQILTIYPDADFALRYVLISQPGPGFNSFDGADFQILLKDQWGKYYEVPAVTPANVNQGVFFNSIAGESEASRPGLVVPEIYLKRNTSLYYDVFGPAGNLPLTYWLRFGGAKIFESSIP